MNKKDMYNENAYDRLTFRVPKGCKTILQNEASARGISVNVLITQAIEKQYFLDLSGKK